MALAERDGDPVGEQLRFLNVVCAGLVVSVAVYAMVAWFIGSGDGSIMGGPELPSGIGWVGVAVAAALLIAAPIVQRKNLEGAARRQRADEAIVAALETYRLGTLLAFVLREGAAIVGLMLTLLTGEEMWCYALSAVTIVAMIWGWPRREDLDGLLAGQPAA
jgi:hypothetical protein